MPEWALAGACHLQLQMAGPPVPPAEPRPIGQPLHAESCWYVWAGQVCALQRLLMSRQQLKHRRKLPRDIRDCMLRLRSEEAPLSYGSCP
jgi:hypothetical protein